MSPSLSLVGKYFHSAAQKWTFPFQVRRSRKEIYISDLRPHPRNRIKGEIVPLVTNAFPRLLGCYSMCSPPAVTTIAFD